MKKTIAVLAGDGVGPEIMDEAIKVLDKVAQRFGHEFEYKEALIGGAAYDVHQNHYPEATDAICKSADAVLLGAVGGPVDKLTEPKWVNCERNSILAIREALQVAVNLRPTIIYPTLAHLSPLKPQYTEDGVDFVIVRELLGDIYFGKHETVGDTARDIMEYTENQVRYALEFAFQSATKRKQKVTLVDKANVLDCSRLWRKVAEEVRVNYPKVEFDMMFVDNATMQIIKRPSSFDVLVMGNMFGDILSDEASVISGSIGMAPSASLGQKYSLYEPIHGSAPNHAGKGTINPIAMILSASMMLLYSFDLKEEAKAIENAVSKAIEDGFRTKDILSEGIEPIGTAAMGDAISERI